MSLSVRCPMCQQKLTARDDLAGRRVKCPACGNPILVQAASEVPVEISAAVSMPQEARPAAVEVSTTAAMMAADLPSTSASASIETSACAAAPIQTGLDGLTPDYRIRIRDWVEIARPHLRAILGPSCGFVAVFVPIALVCFYIAIVPIGLLSAPEINRSSLAVLLCLCALPVCQVPWVFVVPAFAIGPHLVCQAQLKGKLWSFATFFSGFERFRPLTGRALGLLLAELVAVLPALIVSAIPRAIWREPPAAVVGMTSMFSLACSLAGAYMLVRLVYFSHFLIIDRNCRAIEALRGSWLLSRGHFWGLLGTLLLVLGTCMLPTALALCLGLVLPIPGFVFLILMLAAAVGSLAVLPAAVLILNAGYLLIAGSEPLPGHVRQREDLAIRVARTYEWIPLAAVAAVVVLFGIGMGWLVHSEHRFYAAMEVRKREDSAKYAERARIDAERARREIEQQAGELVAFFRNGGTWSTEIRWALADEEPATAAGPGDAGPPSRAGAGAGPPGQMGMAGGSSRRTIQVLILGPKRLLEDRPELKLGEASSPEGRGAEQAHRVEQLPYSDYLLRQEFYARFAEALARGEVQALLVEIEDHAGAGSGGGMGFSGAPGSAPAASARSPAAAGAAFSAPGASGEIRGVERIPLSLEEAAPIDSARLLKVIDHL